MDHEHTPLNSHDAGHRAFRGKWVLVGFFAAAGFFLWSEHQVHPLDALSYLLLLACPLMHLFHHHRHGHDASGIRNAEHRNDRQGDAVHAP